MGKFDAKQSPLAAKAGKISKLTEEQPADEGLTLEISPLDPSPAAEKQASEQGGAQISGQKPAKARRQRRVKRTAPPETPREDIPRTVVFRDKELYERAVRLKDNPYSMLRSFDRIVEAGLSMVVEHLEEDAAQREKVHKSSPLAKHLKTRQGED